MLHIAERPSVSGAEPSKEVVKSLPANDSFNNSPSALSLQASPGNNLSTLPARSAIMMPGWGEGMADRIAYFGFSGPIDSGSVTRISTALNHAVNQQYDGIYLAFSSLGGMIADGVYLYNHLRALPIPVTMHATGNVASVAVTIFAGASVRFTSRHVLFMIHPAAVPGSAEGMAWDRLQQLMNSAIAEEQRSENILRDRYSIPDELLTARRFREVHFAPEDAVKFGIAHSIEEFALPLGCEMYQI